MSDGSRQQLQCPLDQPNSDFKLFNLAVHPVFHLAPPALHLGQTFVNHRHRHAAFCCKVDQVLLLLVQSIQLCLQLLGEYPSRLLTLVQSFTQRRPDRVGQLRVEADDRVNPFHRHLYSIAFQVAGITEVLLPASAEEVAVATAVALAPLHQNPRLDALFVTAPAPHRALQEVVVVALTLATSAALAHDRLNPFEQFDADQRLMTTLDDLALVGDISDVVRIAE